VYHRPDGTLVDDEQSPVLIAALAMVVATGALLLNIFDLNIPGRSLLAVVSLLGVPGIPVAMAMPISQLEVQFVLGVSLSVTAVLLVSLVQLELNAWSPLATQLVLFGIGLTATALAGLRAGRPVTTR
jgi:hypothetical protein